MFNKLKFPTPFGNKKQRQKFNKLAVGDAAFAIEIAKLEIQHNRVIHTFIKKTESDFVTIEGKECPSAIVEQSLWTPKDMTDEERKAKENFLKEHGITTFWSEGRGFWFEGPEEKK